MALWLLAPGCASEAGAECHAGKGAAADLAYTRYAEPKPWLEWAAGTATPQLVWATGTTAASAIHAAFFDVEGVLHGETTVGAAAGYNTAARLAGSGVTWLRRARDQEYEVLFQRIDAELRPMLALDLVVHASSSGQRPSEPTLAALAGGDFYVGWVDATAGAMGRRIGARGELGALVIPGGSDAFEATAVGDGLALTASGASGVRLVRLSAALEPLADVVIEALDVVDPASLKLAARGERLGAAWNGASGPRFAEIDAGGNLLCGPVALSGAGLVQSVAAGAEYAVIVRRELPAAPGLADLVVQRVAAGCRERRSADVAASGLGATGVTSAAWTAQGLALAWEDLPYGVQGCIVQPGSCDESFK